MRRDECWKVVTAELKVSACKVILGWIVEWVVCEPMRSVQASKLLQSIYYTVPCATQDAIWVEIYTDPGIYLRKIPGLRWESPPQLRCDALPVERPWEQGSGELGGAITDALLQEAAIISALVQQVVKTKLPRSPPTGSQWLSIAQLVEHHTGVVEVWV